MMAPRRCPSYSLGWGTHLCHLTHSYWLVIPSTLLVTPLYHHHNVPCYMAPFSAAPRHSSNMRITKIGLIGLDDLNQRRYKIHMWNVASLTPSPEERNHRGNQTDHLWIFSVSMVNVEVAISVKHQQRSRRFWSSRQVIPHVPRSRSWLPPCSDVRWGCH